MLPKFLEHIVILFFERRYPKQNSVIRLKSKIFAPQKFWAGYATGVAAFMCKYCRYISAEFCRYETSPYRPIYTGMPMHRSSSTQNYSIVCE